MLPCYEFGANFQNSAPEVWIRSKNPKSCCRILDSKEKVHSYAAEVWIWDRNIRNSVAEFWIWGKKQDSDASFPKSAIMLPYFSNLSQEVWIRQHSKGLWIIFKTSNVFNDFLEMSKCF